MEELWWKGHGGKERRLFQLSGVDAQRPTVAGPPPAHRMLPLSLIRKLLCCFAFRVNHTSMYSSTYSTALVYAASGDVFLPKSKKIDARVSHRYVDTRGLSCRRESPTGEKPVVGSVVIAKIRNEPPATGSTVDGAGDGGFWQSTPSRLVPGRSW